MLTATEFYECDQILACFENMDSPAAAAINVNCLDVVGVCTHSVMTEPLQVQKAGLLRSSVTVEI